VESIHRAGTTMKLVYATYVDVDTGIKKDLRVHDLGGLEPVRRE